MHFQVREALQRQINISNLPENPSPADFSAGNSLWAKAGFVFEKGVAIYPICIDVEGLERP